MVGMSWRRVTTLVLLAFALGLATFSASGCMVLGIGRRATPVAEALPTRTPKPTFTPFPTPTDVPTPSSPPTDTPIPATPTPLPMPTRDALTNPLTGLPVADAALIQRRPLAARIGNDPVIRPQEGLGLADIVYEEIMDGWTLTRFTAIYLGTNVSRIRPIRSARLSTLAIVPQYDAAAVHSGASDHIRLLISQAKFVDLDEYFHPEPYGVLDGFDWRGRMYTSVEAVHAYLEKKGLERREPIQGYAFDATPPQGAPAASVRIPYPQRCLVDWRYAPDMGRYLRYVEGQPHLEALTQEQISAENVIALYAEHRKTDIVEDSLGSTAIDIVLTGAGRAQIFRDGVAVEARWEQKAPGELIQYYDASGRLIPLKPGRTWIQLVPTDYQVEAR